MELLPGWYDGGPTHQEAAKLWAANGGEKVRRALDRSLAEIAQMIAFDIQQGSSASVVLPDFSGERDRLEQMEGFDAAGSTTVGYVIRKNGGRIWNRLPTDELSSMPAEWLPTKPPKR